MKRLLLILLWLPVFAAQNANAQGCVWANGSEAVGSAYAVAVVTDDSGNVYATGYYLGNNITFGSVVLTNSGPTLADIYLVKYNNAGSVVWAEDFGGIGPDAVYSMAIDSSGNLYLSGIYGSPTISFGTTTLTNISGNDLFLAKLSRSGTEIWAKDIRLVATTSNFSKQTFVTTDKSGNVYLTGNYDSSVTLDSTYLAHISTPGQSVFVAKYAASGNLLWAKSSEGDGSITGNCIATDALGNVYVTGQYRGTAMSFDTLTLPNAGSGWGDFYLIKYSAAGNILWGRSAGDSYMVNGTAVVTDSFGNVYVAGNFNSPTVTFGTTTLTNADPTAGTDDILLVKYDTAGNVLWAERAGGSGLDYVFSMTIDGPGNLFLTGFVSSPFVDFGPSTLTKNGFYIARYNSSGAALWGKSGNISSSSQSQAITHDASGNLYITGNFNTRIIIDTVTLTDTHLPYMGLTSIDVFIAKFNEASAGIQVTNGELQNMLVYPSPVSRVLTLKSDGQITTLTISNLFGQVVYSHWYNANNVQVDISNLPSGIYIMRINGSEVRKFVKQ